MTLRIGDIAIDLVDDGYTMTDSGGLFGLVPRALWARHYQPDEQSRIAIHHYCLLVRASGKTIVVDTGLGSRLTDRTAHLLGLGRPEGDLLAGLARRGVVPEDVDLVINTHLHPDHCGGNTRFDDDGRAIATFPQAEYWVQRLEYADAAFPNERTRGVYFADNYVPLMASGQMRLIDGDLEVVPGMRCVVTPGHTRAHMSVVFEQGGAAALYVADMASLHVHFSNLAWTTAYDTEPLVTLETKRRWQRWALVHDALLLFEHESLIPVGRLAPDGEGKLRVERAEYDLAEDGRS